ncbi:hypothetical protein [Verrucomicrobium spinosum]|uniref:hypothetical protein n=2 Tax=Verrucomicrobium spinosum TaxID=2736 RepID=UPI0001746055|nr:hypothetical protein [Verrucomicrobium spinosum]
MARRVRALILLLLSTMLFALQGQTVVQCLCSGAIALGQAPEACCGECPDESAGAQMTATSPESPQQAVSAILFTTEDCWRMASTESDQAFPATPHVDAPLPTVALLAEDPFIIDRAALGDAPTPAWTRDSSHHPEPTGPPCAILYGALLI